jgi:hypothetical protein
VLREVYSALCKSSSESAKRTWPSASNSVINVAEMELN